ncbi:MAG: SulP family inorganic anion transporter [Phycisphaeraceae bacterium]|nr:SulP family inorganic anion transporter [Phycisphaeraceae bacterium]
MPDILSGMTVALALVPEAVAFAFVAGLDPMIGLYSAFIIGLLTSIFGGRPGMISGATGAMAIVVIALVATHGEQYLFLAVILCGIIQICVGVLRMGKLIRMVPHSVMLGFVNGLAIVIGLSQLESFKDKEGNWFDWQTIGIMAALIVLTMAVIHFLPRLTKAVPSSLAAILGVSAIAIFGLPLLGLETPNVLGMAGEISGGLPTLNFFPAEFFTLSGAWDALQKVWAYAFILAGVGLIESLMTLSLIDEITETRGRGNKECVGQGVANVTCGLFGGMGGCAMIGQSLINVNSGGRNRLSGIVAALLLLAFILFLGPWIGMIPMAALVGVMFMVVIGTFEWASIKMFKRMPKADMLVMVTVVLITVFLHNLALAVLVGVIMAALVFAWQHATHIGAEVKTNVDGSKVYQLHGPLFFASVESFKQLFTPAEDTDDVVIDFYYTRVYDQSGLEAINNLAEKYRALGKKLHLVHLSEECAALLDKAGDMVEVNISEDPHYHVATDRLG